MNTTLISYQLFDSVLFEFLSKGTAVDAQNLGGFALITAGMTHYGFKQGPLHFAEYHVIEIARGVAVQILKVTHQRGLYRTAQGFLAPFLHDDGLVIVCRLLFSDDGHGVMQRVRHIPPQRPRTR